jgi:hypothetical protein
VLQEHEVGGIRLSTSHIRQARVMKKIDDKLLADYYSRKEEREKLWREKDLLLKEEHEDEEKVGMKEE